MGLSATFLGVDTVNPGLWIGRFGKLGYILETLNDGGIATFRRFTNDAELPFGRYKADLETDPKSIESVTNPGNRSTRFQYDPNGLYIRGVAGSYLISINYWTSGSSPFRMLVADKKTYVDPLFDFPIPLASDGAWYRLAVAASADWFLMMPQTSFFLYQCFLFDPWPQGFSGLPQGFVGHGVF